MKKVVLLALPLVLTGCQGMLGSSCPSDEQIKSVMKPYLGDKFQIESKTPLKEFGGGVCEVIVKVGPRPYVVYLNKDATYAFDGNVIDVKNKKNVTAERVEEAWKVSKEDLEKLRKLASINYGSGEKGIILVVNPEDKLGIQNVKWAKDFSDKYKVKLHIVLAPSLTNERAKALICDKKGIDELIGDYKSQSTCKEADDIMAETANLLNRLGFWNTAVAIGQGGRPVFGLLTEDGFKKLIQ